MTASAPRRGRMSLSARVAALVLLGAASAGFAQQPPGPSAAPPAQPSPPAPPAAAAAAAAAAPAAAEAEQPKAPDKRQISYSLGVLMAAPLYAAGVGQSALDMQRLNQGMRDALSGKAMPSNEDRDHANAFLRSTREAAGEANRHAAATFLAENGKKKDVVTTKSGLQYKVLAAGSGESPKPSDQVVVNYRGTFLNGKEFDSSYKRGEPATFPVGAVIPGWTEALQLMKPGAKYHLWIPPQLAYDLRPKPDIPPGSLLQFDVELMSIKQPAGPPPMTPQVPVPVPVPPAEKPAAPTGQQNR